MARTALRRFVRRGKRKRFESAIGRVVIVKFIVGIDLAGDAIVLGCPCAQINALAPCRAEWTKTIFRQPLHGLAAGRTGDGFDGGLTQVKRIPRELPAIKDCRR